MFLLDSAVYSYDIVYKQAVTSEDIFLGMGNKTPATASCEDMVVSLMIVSIIVGKSRNCKY